MKKLSSFIANSRSYPVLAGVAAGLYPTIFYYFNNYTLVNSWSHLLYFLAWFITAPVVLMVTAHWLSNWGKLAKWKKYILPFLNMFVFLFLLKICLYAGLQKKIIVVILVLSGVYALFLYKQYKRVLVIQLILAFITFIPFIGTLFTQATFDMSWLEQPDDIESVQFVQKPNVYFIQPDGYANTSELSQPPYSLKENSFDAFLKDSGFTQYQNFRSSYASTLSSNSSLFMMKHHYYNQGRSFSEGLNARKLIAGENTVIKVFKNNGYKTHFVSESPYLLLNKPKRAFDYYNFDESEVPYIGTGFKSKKEVMPYLSELLASKDDTPKFFFIEIFNPGHIHISKNISKGIEGERDLYLESIDRSNVKLVEMISAIQKNDPNALILIMADHGGFVGLEYTGQIYEKTEDPLVIRSIFSSILAIHWPNGKAPAFDGKFKSTVNTFRVLFAHLANEPAYLDHLQEDGSYVVIKDGAPNGIYQYINGAGEIVFKKQE